MLFLRLIASPTLPPSATDAVHRALAADGRLLGCVSDADVGATFVSLGVQQARLTETIAALTACVGGAFTVARAYRIEVQGASAEDALSDDALRAVAVDIHGAFRASVHISRRTMPAGRWMEARAMGWGPDGLSLRDTAPALPFGGSESSGVAIEVGGPTVIAKACLTSGLSLTQLRTIAAAAGAPGSGFVEVGAYPIGIRRDGSGVIVVELTDTRKVPLHRVLQLMDIEATRYGSRLALGSLLSDAPLELFLDALSGHMGLLVARHQVIETHLPATAALG